MPAAAPQTTPTATFTSIVVGTDFTSCSAVALAQAIRIAAWSGGAGGGGAKVHVVHVIDTTVVIELETALSPMQQNIRDGLVKDAEKAWADFAKNISGAAGAAGLPIEVSINNRIVGILRRAREDKADLLVMGAFGHRAPDVGMGTIATACVRKSMTDVLLVRDTMAQSGTAPFKTIVAAVDFSPTSLRAVERAAMFAAQDGAELHLLHVFAAPWNQWHYRAPTPLTQPQQQKQYRDGLERRLAEFCRPAIEAANERGGASSPLRTRFVLYDYAGHRSGIVEYAGKVHADLIVLGTRGGTNLRDLLLGSTAEKVLEESKCSILAVKPEGFVHPLAVDETPATVPMGLMA